MMMRKLRDEIDSDLSLNLNLTLDTFECILVRLDVKTLMRFKCVSRSFRRFISDPSFVNLHRQQSMKNIKLLCYSPCLVSQDDNGDTQYSPNVVLDHDPFCCRSVLSFSSISMKSHIRSDKLATFFPPLSSEYLLCPMTCDIVCYTTKYGGGISLCNPSTNELLRLPRPSSSQYHSRLGYGYSAQTREYKVVHLGHTKSRNKVDTEINGMHCEVYTLSDHRRVGSTYEWKHLVCTRCVYHQTTSANGRIYWLIDQKASFGSLKTEELILAFDIASETFSTVPRPPGWPLETYETSLVFMVNDGKLCIADKRRMHKSGVLNVWMLQGNCVWTKVYNINILEYSYNGKRLLRRDMKHLHPKCMLGGDFIFKFDNIFTSCNLQTKTLSSIVDPRLRCTDVGIFWESMTKLR